MSAGSQYDGEKVPAGHLLHFEGVGGRDVYNITAPFPFGTKRYLAGRVEERGAFSRSIVRFFEEKPSGNGTTVWRALDDPIFELEDPFWTFLNGEFIFGGVEILSRTPHRTTFRTVFYRGHDFLSLTPFAAGPEGMKDIRLIEHPDAGVVVFTRPKGGRYGLGKIGAATLPQLDALPRFDFFSARLLEGMFPNHMWGGVNALSLLHHHLIGAVGHLASRDADGNLHYSAIAFCYDAMTHRFSQPKIIARRDDFPEGPAKLPQLRDVVFPGGIIRNHDGTALLYAGLSDAAAGELRIADPFREYETARGRRAYRPSRD